MTPSLKCPVCGARFRNNAICPRCQADLSPLMRIAAKAYVARTRAREALLAGDLPRALHVWVAAVRLQNIE